MRRETSLILLATALALASCSGLGSTKTAFHEPKDWEQPLDLSAPAEEGFHPDFAAREQEVALASVYEGDEFQPQFGGETTVMKKEQGDSFRPSFAAGGGAEPNEQMRGLASWYGPGFHGKQTANGEDYDQNGMTAAHKLLPMNTWVKVTNLENGKTAVVRINDRGPYKDNRIIDLTKTAAKKIDVFDQGTARVKLEVLKYPKDYDPSQGLERYKQVVIQVAVYQSKERAEAYKAQLQDRFSDYAFLVDEPKEGNWHVVAGPYDERDQAEAAAKRLKNRGLRNLVRSYRK